VPQLVGVYASTANKQQLYQPISELLGDFVNFLKPISFLQDLLEFYVALGRKPLRKRLRKASADSTSPFFLVQNFAHM